MMNKSLELISPENWQQYELIDCGNFLKLEKFGELITIRPEPQALWRPTLSSHEWEKMAHVKFFPKNSSSGEWKKIKKCPDQWTIKYPLGKEEIHLRLGLTAFKHVGLFPEQAANWDLIYKFVQQKKKVKFLNLFAYTGGASLAAAKAGADVTHVDSIKQVVNWAKENAALSGLNNIRWIVDDALKFVKKEERRGNIYQGIILDPPAYGHGPNGEKWKLEDNILEMMEAVLNIIDTENHLLILNAYSLGLSALVPENLLKAFKSKHNSDLSVGELFLQSRLDSKLPLGVWGRLLK
jgi:23S rRNA (cytosine1962-C5)-methyltransferase